MNILWITNTIFPAPSKALGFSEPVTGGWMYGLAEKIAASAGIRLAVATTYSGREVKTFDIDGVLYYLLPAKNKTVYRQSLEPIWQSVCAEFKPDLVHIHGTEFPHGLACMRSCPELSYVVSIQGLVSLAPGYCYAGMSTKEIVTNLTFRDIVRRDTIFHRKHEYEKRGAYTRECLQRARHIIGRTSWDYAHVKSVTPDADYHFCNESLRDGFYSADKWDIAKKKKCSIFLSQAYRPLKGAHQVFKAAAMLKKDFPEITIRCAGPNIIKNTSISQKLRLSGYAKYVRSLLKKTALLNNVQFLGPLNEPEIIDEYRNAHVFICPSSIENSPNSLGEAQLIGTPAIAAYVGGVADMVTDGVSGLLYRFEEIEMLAENIRRIFTDDRLAARLSEGGIGAADKRHDCRSNLEKTLQIYREVNNKS